MTCLWPRQGMEPKITVSTVVQNHEDVSLVERTVKLLFPDWDCKINLEEGEFPMEREAVNLSGSSQSLAVVMGHCTKNRILDTAFDAMTMNLKKNSTHFLLSRQAAYVGKVAFVVEEMPLGGIMEVRLQGEDLGLWLEQQTWHEGRHAVPRSLGDELRMEQDGTPVEWFDNKGRKTINSDQD